jgi:hypothetical protein
MICLDVRELSVHIDLSRTKTEHQARPGEAINTVQDGGEGDRNKQQEQERHKQPRANNEHAFIIIIIIITIRI